MLLITDFNVNYISLKICFSDTYSKVQTGAHTSFYTITQDTEYSGNTDAAQL
jgi:hypothetical protein